MTDLLPCPFCGYAKPRYVFDCSQGYICCDDCGTQGPCDERAADPICSTEAAEAAWNRRTALAQPEPQGPSDRITSIATAVQECAFAWEPTARLIGNVCAEDVADLCSAVLARWGRPAALPVPVSERLPGAEDCDAEGRCWMCGKVEGDWRLISTINPGVPQLKYTFSHWLPHWALPIPRREEILNDD